MKSTHSTPGNGTGICPLEWLAAAMEAARLVAVREETGRFELDYSHLYTENLVGL